MPTKRFHDTHTARLRQQQISRLRHNIVDRIISGSKTILAVQNNLIYNHSKHTVCLHRSAMCKIERSSFSAPIRNWYLFEIAAAHNSPTVSGTGAEALVDKGSNSKPKGNDLEKQICDSGVERRVDWPLWWSHVVNIAHYLLTPEVYNLCLTSNRFDQPTSLPSSLIFLKLAAMLPAPWISTRLLPAPYTSLLDSLERVLQRIKTGLTSD